MRPNFRQLKKGDRISAREYNRRGNILAGLADSLHIQSYANSTGFHTRRIPTPLPLLMKILEVQSSATGFGMYNCREEIIDKTYLADETGQPKTRELSDAPYLVMNLLESDPVNAGYTPAFAKWDLVLAWQVRDDEYYYRWVGLPAMSGGRMARTTEAAPAATNLTCNLIGRDGNEITIGLGSGIEVYCRICGGGNLDAAAPHLINDTYLFVENIQGLWWCTTIFNAAKLCECYGE